jgi:hypothetical protein
MNGGYGVDQRHGHRQPHHRHPTNGGTVTQDYNLFYGNTANTGGTVGGGANSVIGDPAFVNPAADDYQL